MVWNGGNYSRDITRNFAAGWGKNDLITQLKVYVERAIVSSICLQSTFTYI
jgi:hypothetical protein